MEKLPGNLSKELHWFLDTIRIEFDVEAAIEIPQSRLLIWEPTRWRISLFQWRCWKRFLICYFMKLWPPTMPQTMFGSVQLHIIQIHPIGVYRLLRKTVIWFDENRFQWGPILATILIKVN